MFVLPPLLCGVTDAQVSCKVSTNKVFLEVQFHVFVSTIANGPIKYSIREAIIEQIQTVFRFGWRSYSYNAQKTEVVCAHASAHFKILRTTNLKTSVTSAGDSRRLALAVPIRLQNESTYVYILSIHDQQKIVNSKMNLYRLGNFHVKNNSRKNFSCSCAICSIREFF